ncbi:hypothetical protein DEU56DRAFT_807508, partial [Suillus clintonianus]|uniref:uncharacterized protein n=1 Tax=Suillus clintonianus TaxID=1904413 RepID=UPI001B864616
MAERPAEIAVTSQDTNEKKKEEENKLDTKTNGTKDEDEELELNTDLYRPALETLQTLIRTSTSSMTSIPKPLKFLRPHYLQELFRTWPTYENKVRGKVCSSICSVLEMTYSDTEPRGTLRYRLLSASFLPLTSKISEPGSWGHEYVRHIAAELGEEYTIRQEGEEAGPPAAPEADSDAPKSKPAPVPGTIEDLHNLGLECTTFFLGHKAEPDAVDLFVELEVVDRIASLVDANTFGRVCAYMDRCVVLLPPPDDVTFLRTIHTICLQFSKFPEALGVAMMPHASDKTSTPRATRKSYHTRIDIHSFLLRMVKKQLAFLLARAQIPIKWLKALTSEDADADLKNELPTDILRLPKQHAAQGELEDVYKSHLETTRSGLSANVDSARANLAGTFANAFVKAGFGNDKLMVEADEGNSWVYKNKDHGMMSASYAGSHRKDLLVLLLPAVADDGVSMEIAALSTLALGFVFVGSENGEITSTILQTLMERDDKALDEAIGGSSLVKIDPCHVRIVVLFERSESKSACNLGGLNIDLIQ